MGETDEITPQSSFAEDEPVQESAAEDVTGQTPLAGPEAAAEPGAEPQPVVETDELDEISQSLSDETPPAEDSDGTETTDVVEAAEAAEGTETVNAAQDAATTDTDSFDDIAPPVATAATSPVPEPIVADGQVPWWPFMTYLGAWVVLAATAVWQLLQLPANQVVYESPAYAMTILGGLIMTAMGPLLILAVWLGTRANRVAQERNGLLTSALMKGALVTLSGAIIWWASLVIIDYLRLGRLL